MFAISLWLLLDSWAYINSLDATLGKTLYHVSNRSAHYAGFHDSPSHDANECIKPPRCKLYIVHEEVQVGEMEVTAILLLKTRISSF